MDQITEEEPGETTPDAADNDTAILSSTANRKRAAAAAAAGRKRSSLMQLFKRASVFGKRKSVMLSGGARGSRERGPRRLSRMPAMPAPRGPTEEEQTTRAD